MWGCHAWRLRRSLRRLPCQYATCDSLTSHAYFVPFEMNCSTPQQPHVLRRLAHIQLLCGWTKSTLWDQTTFGRWLLWLWWRKIVFTLLKPWASFRPLWVTGSLPMTQFATPTFERLQTLFEHWHVERVEKVRKELLHLVEVVIAFSYGLQWKIRSFVDWWWVFGEQLESFYYWVFLKGVCVQLK